MADIETKPVSANRQKAYERMAKKYPDKNFDDEDVFFGAINDDYDGVVARRRRKTYQLQVGNDMFTTHKRYVYLA